MLKGSLHSSVLIFIADPDLRQVRTQTEISERDLRSTASKRCFLNNMMSSILAFRGKSIKGNIFLFHTAFLLVHNNIYWY